MWGSEASFHIFHQYQSMTFTNKILIASGAGILTIIDKYMKRFNEYLLDYYDTGACGVLKAFLYENAIQGMTV